MITTVSDKEIAQAATIEQLHQEITAWSITAENLEAELEQKQRAANFWKLTAEVMESVRDVIQAAKTDLLELNRKQGDKLIQMTAERDALKSDAARWVYWRDYHGFSGYFDEGATASPESADIDAACDAAMKRVQP